MFHKKLWMENVLNLLLNEAKIVLGRWIIQLQKLFTSKGKRVKTINLVDYMNYLGWLQTKT